MKEKYELAYQDYLNGMKYKEIASKYDVTINTVKSWKSRYWKDKKGCTQKKKVAHKKVAKKIANDMVENTELDEERLLFCIYCLRYHNATKAYMKVKPNVTYGSACVMGNKWYKEVAIQKEIKRLREEMYTNALLETEDIVQKYIDIAFADLNDYIEYAIEEIEVNGSIKKVNVARFKEGIYTDGSILTEVKQNKDGIGIKLADRMKALDWLSKHMNMATDEQKAKIELIRAQTKATNVKTKEDDPEEIADDGFLEALKGNVTDDWLDYEE